MFTRTKAQKLLKNQELPSMTKRRWEAFKEFINSDQEYARDFQPKSLGQKAWKDFIRRLEVFQKYL